MIDLYRSGTTAKQVAEKWLFLLFPWVVSGGATQPAGPLLAGPSGQRYGQARAGPPQRAAPPDATVGLD